VLGRAALPSAQALRERFRPYMGERGAGQAVALAGAVKLMNTGFGWAHAVYTYGIIRLAPSTHIAGPPYLNPPI
jgi:hypothetical protein